MIVYYACYTIEHNTDLNSLMADIKSPTGGANIPLDWAKAPNGVIRCPAFASSVKNTYVARSPITYSFTLDKASGTVSSDMYSQEEFDEFLELRDPTSGVVTFGFPRYAFYCEQPLVMGVGAANYHKNEFTNKATFLGAEYNIGKHLRFTETAFVAKESGTITIKENDPLFYVRFFTEEPVKLVPFLYTDKLSMYGGKVLKSNRYGGSKPLKFWYDIHERMYRKSILKEIKNNLLG